MEYNCLDDNYSSRIYIVGYKLSNNDLKYLMSFNNFINISNQIEIIKLYNYVIIGIKLGHNYMTTSSLIGRKRLIDLAKTELNKIIKIKNREISVHSFTIKMLKQCQKHLIIVQM